MHWCMDETLAVLAMIPFIGYFFRKLHLWYHAKMGHTCHEKHCDAVHAEHKASTEYPAVMRSEWDLIPQEDVRERYGDSVVVDLYAKLASCNMFDLDEKEVHWYVSDSRNILVGVRNRLFNFDVSTGEWLLG